MQCHRMTLDTGYILLFSMNLMSSCGGYLNPADTTALVAFLTGFIRDDSMLFYSVVSAQGNTQQLHKTSHGTLLMATMAPDNFVSTGRPTVPGCFHNMAGLAKAGVILNIIVDMQQIITACENNNQDRNNNDDRNSYLLREHPHPLPETLYSGPKPNRLLHPLASIIIKEGW